VGVRVWEGGQIECVVVVATAAYGTPSASTIRTHTLSRL